MNILTKSKTIRKEAKALLKKTELIKLLSKYGQINIEGSYKYDLMVDSDIDIHLIAKNYNKKEAIKLLYQLIMENKFRGYLFYDFVKRRRAGFPKGYYIGLKTRFRNKKWKIDVWFLEKKTNNNKSVNNLIEKKLTNKNKIKILKLKEEIKSRKLNLTSVEIYNKILK